jgi:molybdate transport system permease protein
VSSRGRRRVAGNQPPAPALVLGLVGLLLFFGLPLAGLLWRAPWSDVVSVLREHDALEALRLSLICSLSATALSVLFGIPIAWLLARGRIAGLNVIRAVALLPLVLPPVVGGVALFYAFGRRGLIGQWLDRGFGNRLLGNRFRLREADG